MHWLDNALERSKKLTEVEERIARVTRSLHSSLLESDVSPAFAKLAEQIITTLEGK